MKRTLTASLAACFIAGAGAATAQKDYPSQPIRFLVSHPPGGPTDIMARVVGQKVSENIGQTVVIENRPGAGGNIGTTLVARAPADGYTVLINSSAFAVNPSLYKNAGYEVKDFAPIIVGGLSPNILFLHPSVPAKTLKDFIALAKAKPMSYASAGTGTTPHLTVELLLKTLAHVDITHVPFNGAAPAVNSVVGGQLPIGCTATPPAVPMIQSGRLRGLVVTSLQRSAALPDVPTVAESGFPGYEDYTWIAFFVPAGTPASIVDKLNGDIAKALQTPAVRDRLSALGFDHQPNTPQQFSEYLGKEVVKWAKVVKESGARAD